jgi:hypothetical protein
MSPMAEADEWLSSPVAEAGGRPGSPLAGDQARGGGGGVSASSGLELDLAQMVDQVARGPPPASLFGAQGRTASAFGGLGQRTASMLAPHKEEEEADLHEESRPGTAAQPSRPGTAAESHAVGGANFGLGVISRRKSPKSAATADSGAGVPRMKSNNSAGSANSGAVRPREDHTGSRNAGRWSMGPSFLRGAVASSRDRNVCGGVQRVDSVAASATLQRETSFRSLLGGKKQEIQTRLGVARAEREARQQAAALDEDSLYHIKAALAEFGDLHDVEGRVKRAVPEWGVPRISNDLSGCFAVIDSHPDASFAVQARNAQVAGAVGVIIVNTAGTGRVLQRLSVPGAAPSVGSRRSGRLSLRSAARSVSVVTHLMQKHSTKSAAAAPANAASTVTATASISSGSSPVRGSGHTSPTRRGVGSSNPTRDKAQASGASGGDAAGKESVLLPALARGPSSPTRQASLAGTSSAGASVTERTALPALGGASPLRRAPTSGSLGPSASVTSLSVVSGGGVSTEGSSAEDVRALREKMRKSSSMRAAALAAKAMAELQKAPADQLATLLDPSDKSEMVTQAAAEKGKRAQLQRKSTMGLGVEGLRRWTSSSAMRASAHALQMQKDEEELRRLHSEEMAAADSPLSRAPSRALSRAASRAPSTAAASQLFSSVRAAAGAAAGSHLEGDPIFPMPLDVDLEKTQFSIAVPVVMVHASDKRRLQNGNICTLRLVDEDTRHTFHTWPFNLLSTDEVEEDVMRSWLCLANLLSGDFLSTSHHSLAVAVRIHDPEQWTHSQAHEALAADRWRPVEGKSYNTKELRAIAKRSRCMPPGARFQRRLLVRVLGGERLNRRQHGPNMLQMETNSVRLAFGSSTAAAPHVPAEANPLWEFETWFPVGETELRNLDLAGCRERFDELCQDPPRDSAMRDKVVAIYLIHKVFSGVRLFFRPETLEALAAEEDSAAKQVLPWTAVLAIYARVMELPLEPLRLEVVSKVLLGGERSVGTAEVEVGGLTPNVWEEVRVVLTDEAGEQLLAPGSDGFMALRLRVCLRSLALPAEDALEPPPPADPVAAGTEEHRERARAVAERALALLQRSEAVRGDLERSLLLGFADFPQTVLLRYFEPAIASQPGRHFRCFVYNNMLTAISQLHCTCFFPDLIGDLGEIQRHIVTFFWTTVQNRMRQAHRVHYIFDISVGRKQEELSDEVKSLAASSVVAESVKSAKTAKVFTGPVEAQDASTIMGEGEGAFAGVDEEDEEDAQRADLGEIVVLEVLPFDKSVHAGLYDWDSEADRAVLEAGGVMPSGERQFVALAGNLLVPNAPIRVLHAPHEEILGSLPPLWQHHAAQLLSDSVHDGDLEVDSADRVGGASVQASFKRMASLKGKRADSMLQGSVLKKRPSQVTGATSCLFHSLPSLLMCFCKLCPHVFAGS